jgi:hypothetical protein
MAGQKARLPEERLPRLTCVHLSRFVDRQCLRRHLHPDFGLLAGDIDRTLLDAE